MGYVLLGFASALPEASPGHACLLVIEWGHHSKQCHFEKLCPVGHQDQYECCCCGKSGGDFSREVIDQSDQVETSTPWVFLPSIP